MAKSVFYSFHYDRDAWRVQQIIRMGALEGQPILNAQEWEEVKRKGDAAIKKWLADQMAYKSAFVVLIGAQTANRPWVRHEIAYAWDNHKPLVGIRIHGLADRMAIPTHSGRTRSARSRSRAVGRSATMCGSIAPPVQAARPSTPTSRRTSRHG